MLVVKTFLSKAVLAIVFSVRKPDHLLEKKRGGGIKAQNGNRVKDRTQISFSHCVDYRKRQSIKIS